MEFRLEVSVVIPTYNRGYSLDRAINSVLRQSFDDFELIVVDDGSTDNTQEVVASFKDQRLRYFLTENRGVSAARNLGVSYSKAQWLAFLDSDDEWLSDKLERQIEYLNNHREMELVHGEEIWIRKGRRVNPMKKHQKSGGDIFIRSLDLCLISPSAVMLSRDLFYEMGKFDEEFVVCEDYDLWLKITSRHKVGFIESPVINKYGGHEDQLSSRYFAMDYWRIKSMVRLAKEGHLSSEKLEALKEVVKRKGDILLAGYEKHRNMDNYEEVKQWISEVFL